MHKFQPLQEQLPALSFNKHVVRNKSLNWKSTLTITPPLSIWARPCFTVFVPTRALPLSLPFPFIPVMFYVIGCSNAVEDGGERVTRIVDDKQERKVDSERESRSGERSDEKNGLDTIMAAIHSDTGSSFFSALRMTHS
jgi:hypothetical protein